MTLALLARLGPFLTERFVRSPGPGGQNVNKVATAVELRLDVGGSPLPGAVKARLRRLAGARMTGEDELLIDAHEHRTQSKNREAARERLADLIERAMRAPKPRRKTRPTAGSREARLSGKHLRSGVKRLRTRRQDDE